jgi:hypothetical protein
MFRRASPPRSRSRNGGSRRSERELRWTVRRFPQADWPGTTSGLPVILELVRVGVRVHRCLLPDANF